MNLIEFIKFILMPLFVGVGVFILGLIATWIKNMSKDIGDIKIELARHSLTSENNIKIINEHAEIIKLHSSELLHFEKQLSKII